MNISPLELDDWFVFRSKDEKTLLNFFCLRAAPASSGWLVGWLVGALMFLAERMAASFLASRFSSDLIRMVL